LAAFKVARAATLSLLCLLTDAQWLSAGTQTRFGAMTADDWTGFYGMHAQEHAAQIRRARAALRELEAMANAAPSADSNSGAGDDSPAPVIR
jgi:hypothetical protein